MLHRWHIDESQYARHEQRRGRRHAFESIRAPSTAVIVIDMIPFFCEENPYARGIVPNISALADALKAAGGVVAWIVPANEPPSDMRIEFFGPTVAERYGATSGTGPVAGRVWPALAVDADDLALEKSAASALFPGRCSLHEELIARGIDTVIVTGTLANVCGESTVRDAATLGYRTVMVADANAAASDTDLNATLHTVYRSFADVRTTSDLLAMISVDTPHTTPS